MIFFFKGDESSECDKHFLPNVAWINGKNEVKLWLQYIKRIQNKYEKQNLTNSAYTWYKKKHTPNDNDINIRSMFFLMFSKIVYW